MSERCLRRRLRLSGRGWGGRRAGLPPWYTENSAPLFISAHHSCPFTQLTALPLVVRWLIVCKHVDLPLLHILAALSLTANGKVCGRCREMCPHVPRLPTEVQALQGGRECKHRLKRGEKPPPRHIGRIQIHPWASPCSWSNAEPDTNTYFFHSFSSPHAVSLSSWLLSFALPQSGAWMNESPPFPTWTFSLPPALTQSLSFPLLIVSLLSFTLISLPPPSVSPQITTSLPHFCWLPSDGPSLLPAQNARVVKPANRLT